MQVKTRNEDGKLKHMSDTSAKLADEEARQIAERKEIISKVTLEVEAVLIKSKVTFREWQDICGSFMDRQMRVAENLTIEESKKRFDANSI